MKRSIKFIFEGTRQEFEERIKPQMELYNNDRKHGLILDDRKESLLIGLGEGGHNGGNWYKATLTEIGKEALIIEGKEIDGYELYGIEKSKFGFADFLAILVFCTVFLPITLLLVLFSLIRKVFIKNKDPLHCFMIKYMDCKKLKRKSV